VLACAEGKSNVAVARELGLVEHTVGKWRKRFVKMGVDGLSDSPRPNVHRKLSDEKVEVVIRTTLEALPLGSTHWSTRKMARRSGVSRSSVSRLWRAFRLRPHRQDTFTLSTDDFFVEKVRDIVGLYMSPPDHAVVLCVDEKSAIQALERSQPLLPMDFGQCVQRTHTYARHGTTNLFAALDHATGKVIGECFPRIAAMMDKFVLLRSLVGARDEHASNICTSGYTEAESRQLNPPTLGAVLSKLQGPVDPTEAHRAFNAAILTAFNFHIVKTDKGFEMVPKESLGLSDSYVDIRNFTVAD
jgi:transposase